GSAHGTDDPWHTGKDAEGEHRRPAGRKLTVPAAVEIDHVDDAEELGMRRGGQPELSLSEDTRLDHLDQLVDVERTAGIDAKRDEQIDDQREQRRDGNEERRMTIGPSDDWRR